MKPLLKLLIAPEGKKNPKGIAKFIYSNTAIVLQKFCGNRWKVLGYKNTFVQMKQTKT